MIRRLLILVAVGALVSIACFSAVGMLGGFGTMFGHMGHVHRFILDSEDLGPTVTRDLPWTETESLHVDYPSEITYTQGPATKLTVSGPKSIVDAMTMQGDHLMGPHDGWGMHDHGQLTITVASPNTHVFHLSGAQQLTLNNFDQNSLELHLSGATQVTGTGRAKQAEVHMAGASDVNLGKLPVDDVEMHMSGAGDATIDPKVSADISISGAGSVNLKTKPPTLHTHIAGFGSINTPDGLKAKLGGDDKNDKQDD